MTDKEVAVFVENPEVGKYFESVIKGNNGIAKLAVNYILTDYLGLIKKDNLEIEKTITKSVQGISKNSLA
jgi:Asp-tRNA(Asn)/Glu-tRNA(Gln) amidotransferase B subunit